jgi:hypothetical protein
MWEFNYKLGFHSPNTYQIRNAHDYFKDFIGEISMYENLPIIIKEFNNINLKNKSIEDCLLFIYDILYKLKITKIEELTNLKNWIHDSKSN